MLENGSSWNSLVTTAFRRLPAMFAKTFYINRGLTRRETLGLAGALVLSPALPAFAEVEIGKVVDTKGTVQKTQNDVETLIKSGQQ